MKSKMNIFMKKMSWERLFIPKLREHSHHTSIHTTPTQLDVMYN